MANSTALQFIALHNIPAYRTLLAWERLEDSREAREKFLKTYRGSWENRKAYAKSVYGIDCDIDHLPQWLQENIDWTALAKGLFLDTVWAIEHQDCIQPECDCDLEESRCHCDNDDCGIYVFTQTHSGIFPAS